MTVGIIDYGAGNLSSLRHALARLGCESAIGSSPSDFANCERLILPGVGAAGAAMAELEARSLKSFVRECSKPLLGICLGLQLLCRSSEEGDVECLGVFDEPVRKITGAAKVPHVGWNRVRSLKGGLFEGLEDGAYVYFVHSYCADAGQDASAVCDYGQEFAAALSKRNFSAVQFHPERSGAAGEKILANFLKQEV